MRLMRSAGLSVETFPSVPEFLKSIETRLPDCVVLDLHMPQMNGFNVQAHLARKYAALPVIIMTGHDLPQARERAIAGGASAFLRKPVLDRTLLDAISAATAPAHPGGLNGKCIPTRETNQFGIGRFSRECPLVFRPES